MAQVRKLILSIASGSVLYSGMVPAIGLGDITINSGLNQPLEAEIELLEVGDLTESEMRIALAPADVFMRAGVDRTSFLDDLRFTALLRGNKSVIRVVSRKPVREPYLNFVVEVARPTGRLLREYTLLIDPPETLANRPQAAGFQRAVAPSAPSMTLPKVSTLPAVSQGNTYTVARGDSLWKIARGLQAAGNQLALPDLMADIHALNPQAFVGGNIDRLISGATLLLPDRANPAVSADLVTAQPASVDQLSSSVPAPEVAPAPVAARPEEVAAVRQQLDEVLAAQDLQSLQLQQQMNDLQSQLTSLRLQIASKDEQVASLEAQLQEQPQSTVVVMASETATALGNTGGASSGWLSGWLLGFAGGGVLAAIMGGIFWWRRREQPDPEPEQTFSDYQRLQPSLTPPPARLKVAVQAEPLSHSVADPFAAEKHTSVERTAAVVAEPDALDGANIYIAYGRLDEAREVMERSLAQEPGRNDVRLRLLQLLAKLGDGEGFTRHEQQLIANGGDLIQLERIKSAHPDFSEGQSEADPLGDAVLELDELLAPESVRNVPNDSLSSLDSLELDADWSLSSPFDQPEPVKSWAGKEDLPVSDNLELPEVMDIPADGGAQVSSPFANSHIRNKPADELLGSSSFESAAGEKRSSLSSLDHLAGNPQSISRLNMALAYIDQGDLQSACNILNQLISEGDDKQKKQAREILSRIA
jgi:pilus assembly protein FimV